MARSREVMARRRDHGQEEGSWPGGGTLEEVPWRRYYLGGTLEEVLPRRYPGSYPDPVVCWVPWELLRSRSTGCMCGPPPIP